MRAAADMHPLQRDALGMSESMQQKKVLQKADFPTAQKGKTADSSKSLVSLCCLFWMSNRTQLSNPLFAVKSWISVVLYLVNEVLSDRFLLRKMRILNHQQIGLTIKAIY